MVDSQFIAAEPGAAVLLGFTRGYKVTSRFGPFDTQVVVSFTAQAAVSSRSISSLQCTGRWLLGCRDRRHMHRDAAYL